MENRIQIVQKFASVAEHPEQCYEFDIQGNLDTFFTCERNDINFSEAAFLVFDAARIYGRKVDYLEQILLEFNQRSASNISKAIAEKEQDAENTENGAKKDKKADEAREKREREKERALKRAKRMIKSTTKVEFKPKPFEIASPEEISLNLHEQRSELECEEEFDQWRMKNVFPRINVLQSNLQNNNTFYDNLNIDESDCENLDALRDFRIFMDTIDEPIFSRPMIGNKVDPRYEQEYKRSMERANQRHTNIYLPADYIKENYGITLKDNSDYLNMLKYNEEVERLNLRNLTIDQLSKLKVGTYLNNILHGNKQDGKIPEHDSGIDVDDDLGGGEEPSMPDFNSQCTFDELSTLHDETDILMTDLSASIENTDVSKDLSQTTDIDTSKGDESNVDNDASKTTDLDTSKEDSDASKTDDTMNISAITTGEETLNSSETPNSSASDSALDTSVETVLGAEVSATLEVSKDLNRTGSARQSLDDGIGTSECNSPSQLTDIESFVGFNSTDIVDCADVNQLINAAGEPMNTETPKAKLPELDTNIFLLPENLLRRSKIFALSDEFELWMAMRKRKPNPKDPPPIGGKLLKLSNGDFVRVDAESDSEEFLGFDENNELHSAGCTVVDEKASNPAAITNRTCSSDSGLSPENTPQITTDECNQSQTIISSETEAVNDSGVADLNSVADGTLNTSAENGGEQSVQETDLSLLEAKINANSTQLFNETASLLTGFDSGFSELESQLESTAGLDDTTNLNASGEQEISEKEDAEKNDVNQTQIGDADFGEWNDFQ